MSLYDPRLVELARRAIALPPGATHSARLSNPLCGDEVEVAARIEDGDVVAIGYDADACVLCRAGAAWLCVQLEGSRLDELAPRLRELETVMSGSSVPDETRGVDVFRALRDHRSRRGCVLLAWRAFERAAFEPTREPRKALPREDGRCDAPGTLVGRDVWEVLDGVRRRGEEAAVATLVSVVGSSPCPIGSRMVITRDGDFWGSVSGGCVESAVVAAGLRTLGGEPPQVLDLQIANSASGDGGLACGGRVRVHVGTARGWTREPKAGFRGAVPAPDLAEMNPDCGLPNRVPRLPVARFARFQSPQATVFRVLDLVRGTMREVAPEGLEPRLRGAAERAQQDGTAVLGDDHFVEVIEPPSRLVLVGGTEIAQRLARLGAELGMRPVVVDPREAFASASRFPGVERVLRAPGEALPELLDARSAVVMLTHNPRLDDPAIEVALASDAFYVGALGSRKTQAARLARLRSAGVAEELLARLRGPAGLAIGGVGAAEIALSIAAEIVAERRRSARTRRVGAVVLAAGSSERAGRENKLTWPVAGAPMIRTTVEKVLDAGVERCVVVLGHEAERVAEVLSGLDRLELVRNEQHAEGMGGSIAAGVAALGDELDAILVALGDMPFVAVETLRTLVAAHRPSTSHLAIAPRVGRRRGNPVLWPRRYFDALRGLRGEQGGRAILRDAPGALYAIDVADVGMLRDVDRAEDLAAVS